MQVVLCFVSCISFQMMTGLKSLLISQEVRSSPNLIQTRSGVAPSVHISSPSEEARKKHVCLPIDKGKRFFCFKGKPFQEIYLRSRISPYFVGYSFMGCLVNLGKWVILTGKIIKIIRAIRIIYRYPWLSSVYFSHRASIIAGSPLSSQGFLIIAR